MIYRTVKGYNEMTVRSKSRMISLLALILIFAMTLCAMSVSVFAADDDEDEKTLGEKISDWFESDVGQIVGYCVAGVILVAIVVFIIIWIPKDKDRKIKSKTKSDKKIKDAK